MKKIFFSISVLLAAIITMAYLYFSKLNSDHAQTDNSLYAAVNNSGLIFSFQQDKSILDILKGQEVFHKILGNTKFEQLKSLNDHLLQRADINSLFDKETIYMSFVPGKDKSIDYLFSTQMGTEATQLKLLNALKAGGLTVEDLDNLKKITLKDSTVFYLGIKDHLVLLSNASKAVNDALSGIKDQKGNKFVAFIKSDNALNKNSLARLYVNFNKIPDLLKVIILTGLNDRTSVFEHQDTYAALTYNFSKEKVLFTGSTIVNAVHNYYGLFSKMQSQKITINNILPDHTANYTIYGIDNYPVWRKSLEELFKKDKAHEKVSESIANISLKYHLNLEELFPKYFKNQLMSFQLNTSENIGAINLSNGDKVAQLLIDLTENYSDDIKRFTEPDLLYYYFGSPFKQFKQPYYTIADNYMIFSNDAGTLERFLGNYRNNKLLINSIHYTNALNQLPSNSNIIFYIDKENSKDILRKNIYSPYYEQFIADKGLNTYDSFTYQLTGDKDKFQTNILLNKPPIIEKDSLILQQ